jgi:hypothetical protein
MELLLNLLWLTLALPAYCVWRQQLRCARDTECWQAPRTVLMLGCILMLLFPVISATDDLHFIRPEMEESTCSKRALKYASDKAPGALRVAIIPPAAINVAFQIAPMVQFCGQVFIAGVGPLLSAPLQSYAIRGPPYAFEHSV